jgi:hypothetical protein
MYVCMYVQCKRYETVRNIWSDAVRPTAPVLTAIFFWRKLTKNVASAAANDVVGGKIRVVKGIIFCYRFPVLMVPAGISEKLASRIFCPTIWNTGAKTNNKNFRPAFREKCFCWAKLNQRMHPPQIWKQILRFKSARAYDGSRSALAIYHFR